MLRNLVRQDTVFDSEKMEMTCPQRAIPTERDLSVIVKVIDCNHRGDDDQSSVFTFRLADPLWLSGKTTHYEHGQVKDSESREGR